MAQPKPENPLTILVVDDDMMVRSLIHDALEYEGFAVVEADNGIAALELSKDAAAALMVVDAMMPRMDGFELCRRLREMPRTRHTPILMATGLDDIDSVERAFKAGATDFMAKPFNWAVFKHRIRFMLRDAQAFDELRRSRERLRLAELAQREQSQRFETALDNMSQGLCMFGADGGLVVSNRRFHEIYQLRPGSAAPGMSVAEILAASPLFAEGVDGLVNPALAEHVELISRRSAAVHHQSFANGRVITIAHEPMVGGGSVDTFTDVTEQRMAEAQIAHMAHHDALTDLPNRVLFRQRLEEALHHVERGLPCAVLYLDLDRFKTVNDTLGHPIGDALLKAVTERLRGLVRQTDTVARLGGDEFAVVQSSYNHPHDSKILATRIVRALGQPFDIAGHRLQVGTSIGISIAPTDGTDPDQLLKRADIALYRAKSGGRNRYTFFEKNMDALMQARRLLELDLRNGLAAQEFELFYQPLVNVNEGKITGFEALIRWHSPTRGLVLPADFIPLTEEIGLIGELGAWVLKTACKEATTWPDALKVAVNVSAVQFKKNHRLVEAVAEALAASGLDPRRLELEVTESVMVDDLDAALAVLHSLKELGVNISMDDFGTGFSSLSFLRSFPFDKIKIDQSFIRELGKNNDSEAIVRAVTGLCGSLGVTATAEGVETDQQLDMLKHAQCGEIQGFLIAEPRPAGEIRSVIAKLGRSGFASI